MGRARLVGDVGHTDAVRVATEKTVYFDAGRAEVWAAMANVDAYGRLWPWLERFDAKGLVAGDVWTCRVRPPLPYTVSFTIAFDKVEPERFASATVEGEVEGPASIELSDDGSGTTVVVRSSLEPRSTFLRVLSATLPPVARFGHDWVIDTGAKQFQKRAFGQT